jgi:multidrug efflux system outer membrane protein
VQLRGDRAITTVALIRALGGGWDAAQRVDDTAQARN